MNKIDFTEVFNEIKDKYDEYLRSPKIFGGIAERSSIQIKYDDKWIKNIYNLAFGSVLINVKMYNVSYSIEMHDKNKINNFILTIYEDETFKGNPKISISAKSTYKTCTDEYGKYNHKYFKIRYLSKKCNMDIDDITINKEALIKFLNSLSDNDFKLTTLNLIN